MKTIRIRTLLALTMGGLVLAASGAVLTIALFASATNTFELLNDRTVLIIDGIEEEVRSKLDGAGEAVAGFVTEVESGSLREASPEAIQDALQLALATTPDAEVLLSWDTSFMRRLVGRAPDGGFVREGPVAETNQQIKSQLEVMPPGTRQWGAPVVEEGVTYVNVAARARSGNPSAAYVVAAVSLKQFSDSVTEIGRRYGATAFILYGKKQVLAHPGFVENGADGSGLVSIADVNDPVLANIGEGEPVEFLGSARRQYVETLRVRANGTYYLVMYRWLYGYGPEPVAIGAYFPRTEVSDTLRRLGLSAVSGATIGLLGIAAAIVLGGFIARPVRRLAESASAVARFDLDSLKPPASSPISEVDEQARAFGVMIEALRVFQTYVPRRLVERVVALGGEQSTVSETRELTVMFTDIVRFSEIAERMTAAETAAFLNRHFGLLADCIDAEDGTIDKYVGDAVMAFWGAPDRMEDHAARAVAAASRISTVLTADNARRAKKGLKPVRIRIGIHTGPALVGNIGARGRVNYTIVGDTVNDAQRLEALGRKLDAGDDVTVLMSADTAAHAGLGTDEVEDVGAHPLAGGPHAVPIRRLRVIGSRSGGGA